MNFDYKKSNQIGIRGFHLRRHRASGGQLNRDTVTNQYHRVDEVMFTFVVRVGDFLLVLSYVNGYVNKLMYRTNIRLLLQWYRIHSITSARRRHLRFLHKCEADLNVHNMYWPCVW